MNPQALTPDQVASALGLSYSYSCVLMKTKMRHFYAGRTRGLRVTEAAFREYIERNEQECISTEEKPQAVKKVKCGGSTSSTAKERTTANQPKKPIGGVLSTSLENANDDWLTRDTGRRRVSRSVKQSVA